jgi:sugar phosphate isomerase/epimerase
MTTPIDRRHFLASLATGVMWACTGTSRTAQTDSSQAPTTDTSARSAAAGAVGIQLYTLRKDMAADFEGTLERVAAIGYKEVEFAGYYDRTPASVRATLNRLGLSSPASHVGTPAALIANLDQTLASSKEIGNKWVVCPWVDQAERTLEHFRRHADSLNRAGEAARRQGLRVAYHNHDFELATVDGVRPIDLLLERTDPALVDFEMDVFWVVKGGGDPFALFDRWPGRFPLLHVKDMDRAGTMVDVGDGVIDFRRVFAQRAKSGARHFIVEHDNPTPDALTSARRSYAHLAPIVRG